MSQQEVVWMDYSGAPPLLLPEALAPFWSGFYLPSAEDGDATPDLELSDGRRFTISDDFDFAHPRTDYDRLCAWQLDRQHQGHQLYPVGPGQVLAIGDESDGVVGWWPTQRMIITISRYCPPTEQLEALEWGEALVWAVPTGQLYLTNACLHGAELAAEQDQALRVELPADSYVVEAAELHEPFFTRLYRLRLVES